MKHAPGFLVACSVAGLISCNDSPPPTTGTAVEGLTPSTPNSMNHILATDPLRAKRRYNEMTWLMSHNSHAYSNPAGVATLAADSNHAVSDQDYGVQHQLATGVRAFKLSIHPAKAPAAYLYDALRAKESAAQSAASDLLGKLSGACSMSKTVSVSYPCPSKRNPTKTCSSSKHNPAYDKCEDALSSLTDDYNSAVKTVKGWQDKIDKLGTVDNTIRAWACHGIIKSDWDKAKGKLAGWIKDSHTKGIVSELGGLGEVPFMPCVVDERALKLRSLFDVFNSFLRENENEIISLYLDIQDLDDPSLVLQAFKDSNLDYFGQSQDSDSAWPTLQQMVDRNKRLVVFASEGGGKADHPWYLDLNEFVFGTPWQFPASGWEGSVEKTIAVGLEELATFDRSCAVKTGKSAHDAKGKGNKLFLVQHMLTLVNYTSPPFIASGAQEAALQSNTAAVVEARLQGCWKELSFKPGFLLVDFYNLPSSADLFGLIEVFTHQDKVLD